MQYAQARRQPSAAAKILYGLAVPVDRRKHESDCLAANAEQLNSSDVSFESREAATRGSRERTSPDLMALVTSKGAILALL